MASSAGPILAVDLDIDDQIIAFCGERRLQPPDIIRDIARIVCIVHLVREGVLDGEGAVLCGGMAMRCLNSTRLSVYDADTAAAVAPDPEVLAGRLFHAEEKIILSAGPFQRGRDVMTLAPVSYDARFSDLAGATDEFSISVAHRGLKNTGLWTPLNHRYPFPLLAEEAMPVPIMDPLEMLAEKLVAWWLFGHAKHYNDCAFLGAWLRSQGRRDEDPAAKAELKELIDFKITANARLGAKRRKELAAFASDAERRRRLEAPTSYVDPRRPFDGLSYLNGSRPTPAAVAALTRQILVPMLFD